MDRWCERCFRLNSEAASRKDLTPSPTSKTVSIEKSDENNVLIILTKINYTTKTVITGTQELKTKQARKTGKTLIWSEY